MLRWLNIFVCFCVLSALFASGSRDGSIMVWDKRISPKGNHNDDNDNHDIIVTSAATKLLVPPYSHFIGHSAIASTFS